MKLKYGVYCTPSNQEEWDAILDLAYALGVGHKRAFPYSENWGIWHNGVEVLPLHYKSHDQMFVSIPPAEFIAGMYEVAKKDVTPSLEQRLEKLERIVSEEMGKRRDAKAADYLINHVPPGTWNKVRGPSFTIKFDPKASPKNLPFSVALEYAKAGRKIKRTHWCDGAYAWIEGNVLTMKYGMGQVGPLTDYMADTLKNDWCVIP